MKDWFKSWFDSPYYHILYKNRNDEEAKIFLDNIIAYLNPLKKSTMLDQACGKGRHAKYLNSLGFDVTGIDLSQQSIAWCKKFENDYLKFHVHDMRRIFKTNYFDYVFNIFTSIGYFENDREQQLAVDSAAISLKKEGKFVLDFTNMVKVKRNLKVEETVVCDNIAFHIKKKVENKFIIKQIDFSEQGNNYSFLERVEAMEMDDFERFFEHAGLKINDVFGNYSLEKFDVNTSDRLIIIAEKIHLSNSN
jgi:SAM-dependent methyltransferase